MAKRVVWTRQARADLRGIEQPVAMQILKTLARYAYTGEGNTKQLRNIEPPLIRLRAQTHRVFFRDKGEYLEISRVLDRKGSVPLRTVPEPDSALRK
jgi:plasmid stabilization system protein ParE